MHVNEDQILQQDHCHPQHGGDRRGDQQRAAGQMRRAPCRPGVIYEQDDRDDQRDVRGGRSRGAGQPRATRASSGTKEAATIGQLAARPARMCGQVGRWPRSAFSPSSSAYCSAIQYTSKVTSTATTRARVGTWSWTAAMTAAVTTAP